MLGMEGDRALCAKCHEDEKLDTALAAGAETAKALRAGLDELKQAIARAEARVSEAERIGMEVSGPRFDLRQASDALINARSLIHSFALGPVEEALSEGRDVTSKVKQTAEAALAEHDKRRVWLAVSLLPILIVIVLLLLYIRTLPLPAN
jgi:hypothetical protein